MKKRIHIKGPTEANQARAKKPRANPPAPQGSLRCDGVVGLLLGSAELLLAKWTTRFDIGCDKNTDATQSASYWDGYCDAYRRGLNELRTEMVLAKLRQQQPNNPVRHEGAKPRSCL